MNVLGEMPLVQCHSMSNKKKRDIFGVSFIVKG